MRFFIVATLVFFSLAPSALALPCATGVGTCKTSCSSTEVEYNSASSACSTTPSVPLCCVPSGTTLPTVITGTANSTCGASGSVGTTCTSPSGGTGVCNFSGLCEVTTGGSTVGPTTPANVSPTTPVNTGPTGTGITLINPLKGGTLQSFLLNILEVVIRIGAIIVVLMLVFVGYKFVAAQGEPGKITEARGMLLWTVVGALILLGSKAIALGIEATVKALSGGG